MSRTPLALAVLAWVLATPAAAQTPSPPQPPVTHDHGAPAGRLGSVHFATSCAAAVQPEFDRGVAQLHSFWFSAAVASFDSVLDSDPKCVMAHWGIAMSWWSNPFAGFRSPQALTAGLAAVDAARATGSGTEREKAYVQAVELLYRDAATRDQRSRTVAYEKAMEALVARWPDDVEARIFYALALGQTALPTDKTYANQLKAASILEEEFSRQPEHPGLAHYIIHSFDVPPLASRGLNAARRYSQIAPDAPHALHMPSHTFTRLGLWQDSIASNLASAAAAHKDAGRRRRSCTRSTTRSTPTCRWPRTRRPGARSTSSRRSASRSRMPAPATPRRRRRATTRARPFRRESPWSATPGPRPPRSRRPSRRSHGPTP